METLNLIKYNAENKSNMFRLFNTKWTRKKTFQLFNSPEFFPFFYSSRNLQFDISNNNNNEQRRKKIMRNKRWISRAHFALSKMKHTAKLLFLFLFFFFQEYTKPEEKWKLIRRIMLNIRGTYDTDFDEKKLENILRDM